MSSNWHDGGLYYKGVEYYVGPSPSHIVLNLNNQMSFPTKDVHQVIGTIRGSIEDEVILLGNHRDSWGPGAGDSISGAAALMEVARSFATAYRKGWRPRRSIVFISWEGAETGQVGSQPWIASHLPWLQKTAVAYLNVVVAAAGTQFQVKATPLLQGVIHRATKAVASPEGGTVFDHWGGELVAAGGGDAIPFLETACVSTTDLSFGAVYWPYHSNFDTFTWMNTSGDPGWKYHVTTAKLWSLITSYLSESPVLQIKAADYAVAMRKYVKRIKDSIPGSASFDLGPLEDAITSFHNASISLDAYASSLRPTESGETFRQVNQKYMNLERQFCYDDAHLIYEFSAFYTDPPEFPRLYRSLQSGNLEEAQVIMFPQPFFSPTLMLTTSRNGWTSSRPGSEMPLISRSCKSGRPAEQAVLGSNCMKYIAEIIIKIDHGDCILYFVDSKLESKLYVPHAGTNRCGYLIRKLTKIGISGPQEELCHVQLRPASIY